MAQRHLVIAAHPDDEILGCGGTMAKLSAMGHEVLCLFVSDGETSRSSTSDEDQASKHVSMRKSQARQASRLVGALEPVFLDYPDNALDTIPSLELAKSLSAVVSEFAPTNIFTHSDSDLNIDHRLIHEVSQVACRSYNSKFLKSILYFEIPSTTEQRLSAGRMFAPNIYVDISNHLDDKKAAMAVYSEELRFLPNLRSADGMDLIARYRGAVCGISAAEAFVAGRIEMWPR